MQTCYYTNYADIILNEESYKIIGICMEVRKEIENGLQRSSLQRGIGDGVY